MNRKVGLFVELGGGLQPSSMPLQLINMTQAETAELRENMLLDA